MLPAMVDSGTAAIEAYRNAQQAGSPYEMVLLDVQMPGLDGFETAKRLKTIAGALSPTIMMLTSADSMGDAARCRALGVESYLIKPVRQAALRTAIVTLLQHAPAPIVAQPPRSWVRSQASRRILLAEDNIVNQRVAMGVLKKAGHVVTIASNGREAVAAAETGRFDVILMDMQMPEMSGAQAMAAIRAREAADGGHVPIIA
jgi:CheY-like chemotaxis protein